MNYPKYELSDVWAMWGMNYQKLVLSHIWTIPSMNCHPLWNMRDEITGMNCWADPDHVESVGDPDHVDTFWESGRSGSRWRILRVWRIRIMLRHFESVADPITLTHFGSVADPDHVEAFWECGGSDHVDAFWECGGSGSCWRIFLEETVIHMLYFMVQVIWRKEKKTCWDLGKTARIRWLFLMYNKFIFKP